MKEFHQCLSFPKWVQKASGHFSFTFYGQKRESTEIRNFHGSTTACNVKKLGLNFRTLLFMKKNSPNLDIAQPYSITYPKCNVPKSYPLSSYSAGQNMKSRWVFFLVHPVCLIYFKQMFCMLCLFKLSVIVYWMG